MTNSSKIPEKTKRNVSYLLSDGGGGSGQTGQVGHIGQVGQTTLGPGGGQSSISSFVLPELDSFSGPTNASSSFV